MQHTQEHTVAHTFKIIATAMLDTQIIHSNIISHTHKIMQVHKTDSHKYTGIQKEPIICFKCFISYYSIFFQASHEVRNHLITWTEKNLKYRHTKRTYHSHQMSKYFISFNILLSVSFSEKSFDHMGQS